MRVLVVNAGSSSLKLRVLDPDDTVTGSADLPAPRGSADAAEVAAAVRGLGEIAAVGHRIVHGGTVYSGAVLHRRAPSRSASRALTDLAPLHQPKSLAAMAAVGAALPDAPAVACFDTAFHAGMPAAATTYALPPEWRKRWDLRRYGFHGLSHAYASRRAAELLGRPVEELRIVSCHLGAGASLAAVAGGRSVDTTMGFTPLEGLVMATRSGSVDPGLVIWLLEHVRMPPAELAVHAGAPLGDPRPRRYRRHAAAPGGRDGRRRGRHDRPRRLRAPPAGVHRGDDRGDGRARRDPLHRRRRRERARDPRAGRGRPRLPRRRASTRPATPTRSRTRRSATPARRCARSSSAPARTSRSSARCGPCWGSRRRDSRALAPPP